MAAQQFPQYDSSRFMWHKDSKNLTAEVSDMCVPTVVGGLCVKSVKTGKVVTFVLSRVEHDREGDVAFWQYLPTEPCGVHSLKLWND